MAQMLRLLSDVAIVAECLQTNQGAARIARLDLESLGRFILSRVGGQIAAETSRRPNLAPEERKRVFDLVNETARPEGTTVDQSCAAALFAMRIAGGPYAEAEVESLKVALQRALDANRGDLVTSLLRSLVDVREIDALALWLRVSGVAGTAKFFGDEILQSDAGRAALEAGPNKGVHIWRPIGPRLGSGTTLGTTGFADLCAAVSAGIDATAAAQLAGSVGSMMGDPRVPAVIPEMDEFVMCWCDDFARIFADVRTFAPPAFKRIFDQHLVRSLGWVELIPESALPSVDELVTHALMNQTNGGQRVVDFVSGQHPVGGMREGAFYALLHSPRVFDPSDLRPVVAFVLTTPWICGMAVRLLTLTEDTRAQAESFLAQELIRPRPTPSVSCHAERIAQTLGRTSSLRAWNASGVQGNFDEILPGVQEPL
jgi:hypothetical protein